MLCCCFSFFMTASELWSQMEKFQRFRLTSWWYLRWSALYRFLDITTTRSLNFATRISTDASPASPNGLQNSTWVSSLFATLNQIFNWRITGTWKPLWVTAKIYSVDVTLGMFRKISVTVKVVGSAFSFLRSSCFLPENHFSPCFPRGSVFERCSFESEVFGTIEN